METSVLVALMIEENVRHPFFATIIRVNHERITTNAHLHRFDPCFRSTA